MYKFAYDNRDGAKKLWRIGIVNGYASVEACEVPTSFPTQSKITWSKVLDIGEAIDVDIVFDARWTKDDVRQKWLFNAINEPWIFWVDNSGNLYVRQGSNPKLQLADGVSQISVIRGWKNVSFYNDDQGIIVAYLKSGVAYYRSYCLQPPDKPALWELERQLPLPTPIDYISVARTNDYRIAISSVSNGRTSYIYSVRDWAGMSIPIERITASPADIEIIFRAIEYYNSYHTEYITVAPFEMIFEMGYALTDNGFVEIYNEPILVDEIEDWGKVLIFRTEHDLRNFNPADFEIVDAYNRTYYANTIEQIGDRTYKLNFLDINNFHNVDKVGTLKFKGLYATNAVSTLYEPFESVFHPINLVPTYIPLPEVESIWNE